MQSEYWWGTDGDAGSDTELSWTQPNGFMGIVRGPSAAADSAVRRAGARKPAGEVPAPYYTDVEGQIHVLL